MRSRLTHLIALIVRRPRRALALAAVPVLALASGVGFLGTDNSLAVWFVRDDPALERYRAFLAEFGNDEVVVLAYASPAGATEEEMSLQREASVRLAAVEGVERVVSAGSLMRLAPGADAAAAGIRRLGLATDDGAMAIYAWLEPREDLDAARGAILDRIEAAAAETLGEAGREVRMAGVGVLYEGLNRQTERDAALFLGLAVLIMAVLLRLVLGAWAAVGIALGAPLVATASVLGLMAWTGHSMNLVLAALPALVLVIGVAASVHVFIEWFHAWRARPPESESERRALAVEVVSRMAMPTLIAALTTALGFLALVSSRMAVIRELGMFAAAGMLMVWALAILGCAAGLALARIPAPERALGKRVGFQLAVLGPRLRRRRVLVWAGFAVATAVMVLGGMRVAVDTHTIGLLPADHRVVRDDAWIEANLGPYTPLEFVVRPSGGHALEPAAIEGLRRWQAAASAHPGVGRTLTIADLLALAGVPEPGSVAIAEAAIAAYQAAADDDLGDYLTADRRATRATAFVPMGTARDFETAVQALAAEGDRAMGRDGAFTPAGYLPLYVRIIDYTVSSAVLGLGLAFLAVFIVLALLLRSPRLVLAAIPPNLFAVATVYGGMGWLGIPLDIATATVGAIVLGIAVDDTVHYLHRHREAARAGDDDPALAALTGAGPAMVLTSGILVLGLAVLMAAGSLSIAYFGLLTALAVSAALVADLALLPTLLSGRA